MDGMRGAREAWPALPFEAWTETRQSLHAWAQIAGKIRLAHAPMTNEWWQAALYVTARGLGTSPIPYGRRTFELEFDLTDHQLVFRTSDGETRALALWARQTREFYREVLGVLRSLDLSTHIREVPCELFTPPVPFSRDVHAGYDPAWARRFHQVLVGAARVLGEYRAAFAGKSSPVHFFWGSFDLAVTRFNGKPVRPEPGTDPITRVAYDEECISVGFWPGTDGTGPGLLHEPAFYAYARPEPPGFREAALPVEGAYFSPELGEFLLPYERVRAGGAPEESILAFARSAYAAAADRAGWDRGTFERPLDPLAGSTEAATLH